MVVTEPIPSGRVRLVTSHGIIEIELWPKESPLACRNFVQLCLEGYYDGVIFHRIVPGFIIQTGDPTGTGTGGESIYDEGYFNDEISARLKFSRRGLVAMANLGTPHTNTSQFFFTLDRADELQNKNTIFGSVVGDTIYNVMKIGEVEMGANERPIYPPTIKSIQVLDNPFSNIVPRITAADRKAQAKARKEAKAEKEKEKMKAKHRKLLQNKGLLSFADEAGFDNEDETEPKIKFKSAHDLAGSTQLSAQVLVKGEPSLKEKETFRENLTDPKPEVKPSNPDKMHEALKNASKRHRAAGDDGPEKMKKSRSKEKTLTAAEKLKAEIEDVQTNLLQMIEKESDSEGSEKKDSSKTRKGKHSKSADGKSFLQEEREKYLAKQTLGASKAKGKVQHGEGDIESILKGFRQKIQEASKSNVENDADEKLDGYAGEVDESQNGVLGDVDGDDEGWLSHRLQFRKDATEDLHKAAEYSVVDPLANRKYTLHELAARKTEKSKAMKK